MAVEFTGGLAPRGPQTKEMSALKINQLLYDEAVAAGHPMTGADQFSNGLEPGPMDSFEVSLRKINQLLFNAA